MSFEGLQERLAALQETTTQLQELIDRLATLKFQPGSVPLTTDEESSESGDLSAEITSTLREGEEEYELLQEEVEFLRGQEHDKDRLKEGVEKIGKELDRYDLFLTKAKDVSNMYQLSSFFPKSTTGRKT
jgi:protein transport protein SEC20